MTQDQKLQLMRSDPQIKRLLDRLVDERIDQRSEHRSSHDWSCRSESRDHGRTSRCRDKRSRGKNGSNVKSPSDTTLYAPALIKDVNLSPTVVRQLIQNNHSNHGDSFTNGLSEYLGRVNLQARRRTPTPPPRHQSHDHSSSRRRSIESNVSCVKAQH